MPSSLPKTKNDTLAMKVSPLIVAGLFFILGFSVCRANIGETEAQCIARYGAESEIQDNLGYRQVGNKAASFILKIPNGSLDIRVIFLNGLSCHESFSNSDSSHGLSEAQMKAILDSQSAGLKWSRERTVYHTNSSNETYGTMDWLRSDGATARFWILGDAASQILSGQEDISTKEYTYAQHFFDKENGND